MKISGWASDESTSPSHDPKVLLHHRAVSTISLAELKSKAESFAEISKLKVQTTGIYYYYIHNIYL